MGVMRYSVALLILSAQLVLSVPMTRTTYTDEMGRVCLFCPAGEYQMDCIKCEPCPAGSYTTDWNYDENCQDCFGDCNPKFHLKVVSNCTSTSNLKCDCEAGFRCTSWTQDNKNCMDCEKIQDPVTPKATTTKLSGTEKQMPSSVSSGHSSTSPKLCQSPGCGPHTVPTKVSDQIPKPGHNSSPLAAIVIPMAFLATLALVILICFCRPRDEAYIRQTIAKLWKKDGRRASHKSKEPTHPFPRDSFSAKQQLSAPSAANLGPVHVHNPGTVIFSLLSQFTGQVGPTTECGKAAERTRKEEEDKRDCPGFHPPSSPSIPLSEEEGSRENNIFFPSQEQGKDCHMSKEEML
ncbi:tumor necrosis factor receptor superfamily member 14 [Archocentrus centrarchus]|uniref:tumor necrosis factor receptor superfamily member 14 n=1 Tax=Archocentrus centrarchus TaxID=63155 RepID=UPI0011EA3BD7|nr:tumor necrosis factor receptor superfamily member 14-like [Archocentrus centrarchus]XP_030606447.1 tumor necrosis factor receptor superfamily member 14-like [Archocentrus centrarchus]XP_030606448.1 tumor necrosis factor receptor superfamily member 14-like [Archocentrus centrarchus]